MSSPIDMSSELYICRFQKGIQLLSTEDITSRRSKKLPVISMCRIADTINTDFNTYFLLYNGEVQHCNQSCLDSFGLSSLSEVVSKPLNKVLPSKIGCERMIFNNEIVSKNECLKIFNEEAEMQECDPIRGVSYKVLWYDKSSKLVGVFGCSVIINEERIQKISEQIATAANFMCDTSNKSNYLIGREIDGIYFSPRETEVMQYVLRGKTLREISEILSISRRAVEDYFGRAKSKVGVSKKSELIEFILENT